MRGLAFHIEQNLRGLFKAFLFHQGRRQKLVTLSVLVRSALPSKLQNYSTNFISLSNVGGGNVFVVMTKRLVFILFHGDNNFLNLKTAVWVTFGYFYWWGSILPEVRRFESGTAG